MKKIDTHYHTIITLDGERDKPLRGCASSDSFVSRQEKKSVGIVAITNHNVFDIKQFNEFEKSAKDKNILVLPGVELRWESKHFNLIVDSNKKKDFFESKTIKGFWDEWVQRNRKPWKNNDKNVNIENIIEEFRDWKVIISLDCKSKKGKSSWDEEEIKKVQRVIEKKGSKAVIILDNPYADVVEFINSKNQQWVAVTGSDSNEKAKLISYDADIENFEFLWFLLKKKIKSTPLFAKILQESESDEFIKEIEIGSKKINISRGINVIFGAKTTGKTKLMNKIASDFKDDSQKVIFTSEDTKLEEEYKKLYQPDTFNIKHEESEEVNSLSSNELKSIKSCLKNLFDELTKSFSEFEELELTSPKSFFDDLKKNRSKKWDNFLRINLENSTAQLVDEKNLNNYLSYKSRLIDIVEESNILAKNSSEEKGEFLNDIANRMKEWIEQLNQWIFDIYYPSKLPKLWKRIKNGLENLIRDNQPRQVHEKRTFELFNFHRSKKVLMEKNAAFAKGFFEKNKIELEIIGDLVIGREKDCKYVVCLKPVSQRDGNKLADYTTSKKDQSSKWKLLLEDKSKNWNLTTARKFIKKIFKLGTRSEDLYSDELESDIFNLKNYLQWELFFVYQKYFVNSRGEKMPWSPGFRSSLVLQEKLQKDKKYYFLDEPEAHLGNNYVRKWLYEKVVELGRTKTVVIITHSASLGINTYPVNMIFRKSKNNFSFEIWVGNIFKKSFTYITEYNISKDEYVLAEDSSRILDIKELLVNNFEGGEKMFRERCEYMELWNYEGKN